MTRVYGCWRVKASNYIDSHLGCNPMLLRQSLVQQYMSHGLLHRIRDRVRRAMAVPWKPSM